MIFVLKPDTSALPVFFLLLPNSFVLCPLLGLGHPAKKIQQNYNVFQLNPTRLQNKHHKIMGLKGILSFLFGPSPYFQWKKMFIFVKKISNLRFMCLWM